MKRIIFIAILCSLFLLSSSQTNVKDTAIQIPAYVKDWSKLSILQVPNFFNEEKEKIITPQIGKEEYEKMKIYVKMENWPEAMGYDTKFVRNLELKQEYHRKLGKLVVYKIATFNHYLNGKDFGEYAILRVPYQSNLNWDSTAFWDTVYFLIKNDAIE